MSTLIDKKNQILKKKAYIHNDIKNINYKFAHNQYKTRGLREMALYTVLLHMTQDGSLNTNLQYQLRKIFKKLSPNVDPNVLKHASFVGSKALNKREENDSRKYSKNVRGGVAWTTEEAQAYAFGAMADKILANDSLAEKMPLATKDPNSPVTAKMRQLSKHGYNYTGAKQFLLHEAFKRNRKNIIAKRHLEKYYSNNNDSSKIKKEKHMIKSRESLDDEYFEYFHIKPSTYKDTYPGNDVSKKYTQEAFSDPQPKAYETVGTISLDYQRKLGITPEKSIQKMSDSLNGIEQKPNSIYNNLGLPKRFRGALKRFSANRRAEHQYQTNHIMNHQKQDEGPEF